MSYRTGTSPGGGSWAGIWYWKAGPPVTDVPDEIWYCGGEVSNWEGDIVGGIEMGLLDSWPWMGIGGNWELEWERGAEDWLPLLEWCPFTAAPLLPPLRSVVRLLLLTCSAVTFRCCRCLWGFCWCRSRSQSTPAPEVAATVKPSLVKAEVWLLSRRTSRSPGLWRRWWWWWPPVAAEDKTADAETDPRRSGSSSMYVMSERGRNPDWLRELRRLWTLCSDRFSSKSSSVDLKALITRSCWSRTHRCGR